MLTTEVVKDAIERYAAAVSAADPDAVVACFTEDAILIDPYPSPPNVGHEGIRSFWDNLLATGTPIAYVPEKLVACGDRAVVNFAITIALPDGARIGIEGFEVATVTEAGLISELTAYWDPAQVHPEPAA